MITKTAFALTDEGHKYDAAERRAIANYLEELANARGHYQDEAPFRSALLHGLLSPAVLKSFANRNKYVSLRHERGENVYNPFAGWTEGQIKKLEEENARLFGKKR